MSTGEMLENEALLQHGIAVVRRAVEPETAKAFIEPYLMLREAGIPTFGESREWGEVLQLPVPGLIEGRLASEEAKALFKGILGAKEARERGFRVSLNFQDPYAEQGFHRDNGLYTMAEAAVVVLHCSDEGAFDFAPGAKSKRQARRSFQTVELEAGDMLFHLAHEQYHRGRNRGDRLRASMVFNPMR